MVNGCLACKLPVLKLTKVQGYINSLTHTINNQIVPYCKSRLQDKNKAVHLLDTVNNRRKTPIKAPNERQRTENMSIRNTTVSSIMNISLDKNKSHDSKPHNL